MQNKNHLLDSELIYTYPTKLSELDPFLTIQSGQTTYLNIDQSTYAAGMIHFDKSSLAVTLGRQNELSGNQRFIFNQMTSEFFELSQNPFHLIWSHKNQGRSYALSIFYSSKDDRLNKESESAQVIQGGYRTGFLTLSAAVQLQSEVNAAGNKKLNLKNAGSVSALFEVDNFTISGEAETFTSSQTNAGVELNQISYQILQMALSDKTDFDRNQFYYRFDLIIQNLEYKISGIKEHVNQFPLTLGLESKQNDWLIIRSSIRQTLFINQAEDIPANVNSTNAAFGLGLKFKNITIDGTLTGLIGSVQTKELNSNQFLSQVSLTALY